MATTGRGKKIDRNKNILSDAQARGLDLIEYIASSPTPYHAVAETQRRLEASGFRRLEETETWKLKAGDLRYVVRGGSSIIALQLGKKPAAESGFKIIGAHTDSPNLKLKPRASYTRQGFRQLGVEVYGGVLLHTWLDRDLSIAGRVAVRGSKGGVEMHLVDFERPLCRVSSLAIHLNRDVNRDGLKLNMQTQLPPILALEPEGKKNGEAPDVVRAMLAERLEVSPERILDHDLSLYDVQKGALSGPAEDILYAARLDNLASCHGALEALLGCAGTPDDATRVVALHDHEEVGSRSAQGAAGSFLENVLARVVEASSPSAQAWPRALAASFHVSADMAHAVHPNYVDKHEPQHMPVIGRGPVIKVNANQSYATDGESAAIFAEVCHEAGFEPQKFVARTDLGCGSTIGPITATRLGIRTVDCGNPMLSMHSIREMAGTLDLELFHRALTVFLGGA